MAASRQKPDKSAGKPRKKAKKLSGAQMGLLGGAAFLILILWVGLQPLKGSILYGICKVYIEQTLTYPPEMKVTAVIERMAEHEVRMDYAYLNEYGEYMVGAAQCTFRPDPVTGYALTNVLINRQKQPEEAFRIFNTTIPYIIANPPSLILPPGPAVELKDLQR